MERKAKKIMKLNLQSIKYWKKIKKNQFKKKLKSTRSNLQTHDPIYEFETDPIGGKSKTITKLYILNTLRDEIEKNKFNKKDKNK